jgi:hypothetical protein
MGYHPNNSYGITVSAFREKLHYSGKKLPHRFVAGWWRPMQRKWFTFVTNRAISTGMGNPPLATLIWRALRVGITCPATPLPVIAPVLVREVTVIFNQKLQFRFQIFSLILR